MGNNNNNNSAHRERYELKPRVKLLRCYLVVIIYFDVAR